MITVDALHAQKTHADYLVLERAAHYLITVKGNQAALHHQLTALPWTGVPPAHTSEGRAHGLKEDSAGAVTQAHDCPRHRPF